jgi:hypothetical protein
VFDDPPEARKALWEEQWKRGGFNWYFKAHTVIKWIIIDVKQVTRQLHRSYSLCGGQ